MKIYITAFSIVAPRRKTGSGSISWDESHGYCQESLRDLPFHRFRGTTPTMSSMNDDLLQAIDLALAGQWDTAHNLVQQYESNSTASWIHAVLHKIQGDVSNSHYWYRRAGRMGQTGEESRAELTEIRTILLART